MKQLFVVVELQTINVEEMMEIEKSQGKHNGNNCCSQESLTKAKISGRTYDEK